MLDLHNIHLQFSTQFIFDDLSFSLFPKQKIGVVGKNGSGKTTLFALILNTLQPDQGEVHLNKHVRLSFIEQEIKDAKLKAIDYVIAGDKKAGRVYLQIQQAEADEAFDKLADLYHKLDELQAYDIKSRAYEILHGLGFKDEELEKSISNFSGGWQMRLNLARCLIAPSDLLLLDEPTNHLDLDALFWLEDWLKAYAGSVLLISHDREFLDSTMRYTLAIEDKKAKLYAGNYSSYEKQRAEHLALQQAMYEKQQKKRDHMMGFVNRFKAKASKAKQAQSRLKMIEKLPMIALAQADSPFSFEFKEAEACSNPLLSLESIDYAYDDKSIFKHVNFSINKGDRIGLLGLNGAGKSTLIKLIADDLKPKKGESVKHKNLNLGYFAQHQLEILDLDESPLWHLKQIAKGQSEADLRSFLGGFAFSGDMALRKVENFSGGEKSRLALALIVWQKPNLLLLDEPTNHLDIDMREALTFALQSYDGALIIVSHDRHLLRSVVDEFWLVANQQVKPFKGDLDDYHEWSQQQIKTSSKEKPVEAAPVKPKPSNKRAEKIEKAMEKVGLEIQAIDEQLTTGNLYQENKALFDEQTSKRESLLEKLEAMEEEWLDLTH
jgi:ATP-binding cassette, subfamily F, member 3